MIVEKGNHYLYRHIRLDKCEPFYIGVGTKRKDGMHHTPQYEFSRAYDKSGRSSFWKNIVSKTGYEVEILLESDDYEFIKQKEIEFIALYGRKNLDKGTLCNLTDGGDGTLGAIPTEVKRLKISNSNKGKIRTDEMRLNQSLAKKGKKMSDRTKKLREGCMPTGENHSTARLVLNYETGIFYSSISEASEAHSISRSYLGAMLNNSRKNFTPLVYAEYNGDSNYPIILKYEPRVFKKHTEETKQKLKLLNKGKNTGKDSPKAKKVIDTENNVIYGSAKDASNILGIDYHYLCARLNPNNIKRNNTSLVYAD